MNICTITASDTAAVGVNLSAMETATLMRVYRIQVESTGAGTWRRLVPTENPNDTVTWSIDLESSNNVGTLRIVRSGSSATTTTLTCKVTALPAPGKTAAVAGSTTTGSGATSAGTYDRALISQVDGKVGINTANPAFELDVAGSHNVSGTYRIGGANVLTSTALGSSVISSALTSLGTMQNLAVSGNVSLTGLTSNTNTGNVIYVNTRTGQLHFGNPPPGNLLNVSVTGNLSVNGAANLANLMVRGSTTLQSSLRLQNLSENVTGNALYIDTTTGIISRGTAFRNSSFMGSWTSRTTSSDTQWTGVTYGNGLFVAVGFVFLGSPGNRVMTSPDGITWTIRNNASDFTNWRSVTWGNGLFVAVANNLTGNRVMTSPDGINWTLRTTPADNEWYSVTYGNGLFVAVSIDGTGNRVMTSPDGITWTLRTSAADNEWYSVTYGNGLFVAVSATGTGNRVMTSPDGITWTIRTSAADNSWFSVTWGNGLFVAVSGNGTGNRVMTSPDGINWTIRTSAADNSWSSITYGDGLFVAVAIDGTGNRVMTSPDGITWTLRNSAADNMWWSVAYGNGLFVAVSWDGTGNRVMTLNYLRYFDFTNLAVSGNVYLPGLVQNTATANFVAVDATTGLLARQVVTTGAELTRYIQASATTASTTSTTYVTVLTQTAVPAGRYLIMFRATTSANNALAKHYMGIHIAGTLRSATERVVQNVAAYENSVCASWIETFTASTDVTLRHRSNNTLYTVSTLSRSLIVLRLQ